MSDARRCDICGTYYEVGDYKATDIAVIGYYDRNFDKSQIDCCSECWRSIQDHINILKYKKKEK